LFESNHLIPPKYKETQFLIYLLDVFYIVRHLLLRKSNSTDTIIV